MSRATGIKDLVILQSGTHDGLRISPRWPDSVVKVSPNVLKALQNTQRMLSPTIQLIVTRGYQPESQAIYVMRFVGSIVFRMIYPGRWGEAPQIFSHNGHADDGDHVDVAVGCSNRVMCFLPLSVFTPLRKINEIERENALELTRVRKALRASGFAIHSNPVEALQIHCDWLKEP